MVNNMVIDEDIESDDDDWSLDKTMMNVPKQCNQKTMAFTFNIPKIDSSVSFGSWE